MTESTGDDATKRQRTTGTSATASPRDEERTGDPNRGTERERADERVVREERFRRAPAMPADRHE